MRNKIQAGNTQQSEQYLRSVRDIMNIEQHFSIILNQVDPVQFLLHFEAFFILLAKIFSIFCVFADLIKFIRINFIKR